MKLNPYLVKFVVSLLLVLCTLTAYVAWIGYYDAVVVTIGDRQFSMPIPDLSLENTWLRKTFPNKNNPLNTVVFDYLEGIKHGIIRKRRQAQIDKVESFFASYTGGAVLKGYGDIIVDQADKCGGDYRVLVGIAGSESGLGRVMYKKYNPYGYLNGVQYGSLEEALTDLSCKISQQHIAPCGTDLWCLGRRYAGPGDDLSHFVSKVRWFMEQVS